MKNDDGHTKAWNAEATKKHSIVVKSARGQRQSVDVDNYGMPRFYVHATGWVNDIGAGTKQGALASHGTTSLMSKQSIKDIEKWETAMLRTSYPDADANPKEAALAASHEARLARGLKKMAQLAQTQKLWNAAGNDEITASNIGHAHPSEMSELQRMSPEDHLASTHAHVTSATQMSYHPLKWMQQQRAPAVKSRTARTSKLAQASNTVSKKAARFQQLWNAGADDEVGGNPNLDSHGNPEVAYHPMKWISEQRDPSELGSSYAPREHNGRVFQEHRNHVRNYEGSYVNDNSIGIKVDALKGRQTMLAELPAAKTTTLDATPAPAEGPAATEETHDENEEIIKMLDELRNQAMGAYDSMPDGTPEIMKAMVKADYEKVMEYLESVRAQAIGQDNGAPEAAAKSGSTVLASVRFRVHVCVCMYMYMCVYVDTHSLCSKISAVVCMHVHYMHFWLLDCTPA
jgi:hypothetical protein